MNAVSSHQTPRVPAGLRHFLGLILILVLLTVSLGTELHLYTLARNPQALWRESVLYVLPVWIPWIALTPLLMKLALSFRLDRRPRFKALCGHVLALAGIMGCHLVLMAASIMLEQIIIFDSTVTRVLEYFRTMPLVLPMAWEMHSLLVYPSIVAVAYILDYRKELRDRQEQASRLEAQLVRAQLHSLKNQLHPHFLFNALNAISTLMRTDMDSAEQMLDMLAELLRRSLRESAMQEVPLSQEIDFLSRYLAIEQIRFSNRLQLEIAIEDGLKEVLVPHLILQPLVENAIRHGIGPKIGPGCVRIEARREGDRLALMVQDDGAGLKARKRCQNGEGVGLANTRARLEQLYGPEAHMAFGEAAGGGFQVCIVMPLRASSPEQAGMTNGGTA